ncbi:MAG: UDP-glucose 4-epimerase GalE [Bacteroidales bacterium]|nr:UDP-glucose 4-epimerase GalE [Bacteroidales bacterium]
MSFKILVTGGTGYIGSHTTVELLDNNFEVFIIDNLSNSQLSVIDGITKITNKKPYFYNIDLKDKTKVHEFFKKHHDIDAIIHFAAYKSVSESIQKPLMYYENNILSLIHLLENMINFKISYLVFSSSCTVYGEPDSLPIKETAPIKEALSPYGYTKQISEKIIKDTIQTNNSINSIILRYFNPIGAHPSGFIGELPLNIPNNLVPYLTQTAAGVREVLNIYGNDYNTPDGTCIRDFIHVVDLAKAHIAALNRLLKKENEENYEIFNIGTGKGHSVYEIVKTFEKVNNIKVNYRFTKRREGDIEKVWADTTKANKMLKWKATYTIEDALKHAWLWEKNYRGIK